MTGNRLIPATGISAFCILLLSAACMAHARPKAVPADTTWSRVPGTAQLAGYAYRRAFRHASVPNGHGGLIQYSTGRGALLTCAGQDVLLMPQGAPFDRAVDNMFRYNVLTDAALAPADVAQDLRHLTCGPDGHFTFGDLPAGAWYVVTMIGSDPGDVAVSAVRTQAGQTAHVTLQHRWNWPPSWRHPPSLW